MQETKETRVQSMGQEDPLEERKWHPIPVFLPGNPTDRGAWWATVHGAAKNQTERLSTHHTFKYILLL